MNRYLKRLLAGVGLAILPFRFNYVTYAQVREKSINKPVISSKSINAKQNKRKRDNPVRFIADVNASIDAAGVRGGEYTANIKRQVQFDVLRIREVFLHFGFQEDSLFDSTSAQLDHEFEYLGIGYKTTKGRIKLFWDHTCYNPSRKLPKDKGNNIHWNELGIGYEATGMMMGHKNHGIRFNSGKEWLNHINWRASLSRVWMRTENVFEWMFKIDIRNDIFRMTNQVFFCRIGINSIYDERGINLNPSIEIGDRISFDKDIYLVPFVTYKHLHDWYRLGQGQGLLFTGLSFELCLDQKGDNIFLNKERANNTWTPMFNISGGYANFINNEDYGHKSDVAIDLNLLRFNKDETFGLDTYVGILTLPHDLNPYIVRYKIGPSFKINLDNIGIRFFYSYSVLYSIEYENMIKNYHLVGLDFKDNTHSFWNWNIYVGAYPSSMGFDYWGDLQGSLGCHFLKGGIAPYINCTGHHLQGNSPLFGHAIEAGIKIPGNTGSFSAYICMQEDFDIFRFGKGSQKLLGLGLKF